jgi:DNA-directed RNA polymerase beta' subunit
MLQTIDAQIEGRMIMYCANNVMNSAHSGPEAGLVMNSVIGGYLLTKPEVVFSEQEFYEGVNSIEMYEKGNYTQKNLSTLFERLKKYPEVKKYSGKSLTSLLFPEDFLYTFVNSDGGSIKIRNGILVEGVLTKAQVGSTPGSIIQSLWKQYGMEYTIQFISNANFLFNWYSFKYGMTISFKDIKIDGFEEFNDFKLDEFEKLNKEVISLPKLNEDVGYLEKEEREQKIIRMINDREKSVENKFYTNYLERNNSLFIMLNSKAKGNERQIRSSAAFVGQNMISQDRPEKLTSGGKRWLPTFHVDDMSIYSRGFAKNSYYQGLNPDEFFAQAQSARITQTDQAMQTAETGTLQRKMVKAQENLIVTYDGTVRNHNNVILQFNYGSGFDAANMVVSYNNLGMKALSFINLKEEVEKVNTSEGFDDFDVTSYIVKLFNTVNKKYGDEKLVEEEEDRVKINNLDDFQEILTSQTDDFFEISVDMD